jgi:glucose/arabinose dehydrogenase
MQPIRGLRAVSTALLTLLLACTNNGGALPRQEGLPTDLVPPTNEALRSVRLEGHIVKPASRGFSEERLRSLQVPPGFSIGVFARGLENPRVLAAASSGAVYVSERKAGRVTLLRDTDGDGVADERRAVASGLREGLAGVHGLALHEDQLFMVTDREVYVASVQQDGSLSSPRLIAGQLPDGGQHPNRTLAVGPDGRLYVSVGSTCNACEEPNEESATLLQMRLDGSERRVFAKGLRNTIGFGWHPVSRQLWGMDHNSDWRGDDFPPEELNLIEDGGDYGWPFCAGKQVVDRHFPGEPEGMTRQERCAQTRPSVLEFQGHSAPMTLVFYTGSQFPQEYRNDAFVAMRGSWNRNPPTGYKVVRIRFDAQGSPQGFEDFVTGWLLEEGRAQFGRLTGTAVAADGALLVTDDENGIIYRIAWRG